MTPDHDRIIIAAQTILVHAATDGDHVTIPLADYEELKTALRSFPPRWKAMVEQRVEETLERLNLAIAAAETVERQMRTPVITLEPCMRSGDPCVNQTRLSVDAIVGQVEIGTDLDFICRDFQIQPPDVLIACWYVARWGTRKQRKRWAAWLKQYEGEMWRSRWAGIPLPTVDV